MRFLAPFFFFLTVLLSGCLVNIQPPNNADFEPIKSLHQLEGVYRNLGESGSGTSNKYYLSLILWPDKSMNFHSTIQTIEVRVRGEGKLVVKAYAGTDLIRKEMYIEGKDFTINSGRIVVKRKLGLASQGAAGPTYESAELGLDKHGDGKYKSTNAFAGIVLLIPLAMSESDEVRFVRLAD